MLQPCTVSSSIKFWVNFRLYCSVYCPISTKKEVFYFFNWIRRTLRPNSKVFFSGNDFFGYIRKYRYFTQSNRCFDESVVKFIISYTNYLLFRKIQLAFLYFWKSCLLRHLIILSSLNSRPRFLLPNFPREKLSLMVEKLCVCKCRFLSTFFPFFY